MNLLTNSALGDARACLRLYRNKHVLLRESVQAANADASFGTLMHVALEAWWKLIGHLDDQIESAMSVLRDNAQGVDAFTLARAEALLVGYHAVYGESETWRWETLATELEFRAPLVNPETGAESKTFRIGGKLDGLVLLDGRALVLEHKTSSEDISPGSFYWRRKRMDGQVSIYFDGARALGHDVGGCLYDVLGKPDLRPLKATPVESRKYTKAGALYAAQRANDETPAEYRERLIDAIAADPGRYFMRPEIARDQAELEEAARDRWQLATLLRDAMRTNTWPRNPDACMRFGKPCQFIDVCSGSDSLDDPHLFRAREAHPELAIPATSKEETQCQSQPQG